MRISHFIVLINLIFTCYILNGCVVKGTRSFQSHRLPGSYQTTAEYETERNKLLAGDSMRSFDASIRLSAKEELVNQQLAALQKQMLRHYDSVQFFPPSHNFYKSKEHIYSTGLFKILQKMPKGGVHHLHPTAAGSFWWIVNRSLYEPHCYVYWLPDNNQYLKGQLQFFPEGKAPAGFYRVSILKDSIEAFPRQLHDLLTFDVAMSKDSVNIWREFESCFRRIGGFTSYQPVYEDLFTATFDSLAADGIQHVELRAHLGGSLYDLRHSPGSYPYDSIIHFLQNAVKKVRTSREPDFSFSIIYTSVRKQPLSYIKEDIKKAFEVRKKYPDLVKGYDLVAQEDAGHTTQYFLDAWLSRDSLSKVYGIDLPLCLHAGESDWQHVTNLYDAMLLKSTRIGHGFNLSFFPAAEELALRLNTCIEVSPLSNQILGYIGDLRMHPAHAWINRGIQISISPDDPGVFDYVGVTPDYWSIFLAWELDLRALKKLALNGIEYSHLSEAAKKGALSTWQKKWDRFIEEVSIGNSQ